MKRWIISTALLLALAAVALPFVPVDLFRPMIERALTRGLGRKVEIGSVHVSLFPGLAPGPGFAIDQVTIYEDPRAGIEPFAHADSLGASVRLLSLFKRRLEFSSLNLGDANINLVKTDAGPWNYQFLLASATGSTPSIRMRGGRVNFKLGDTKSVFFFNDANLDVSASANGSVGLRFDGAPSRTDRSAQEFGYFYANGSFTPNGPGARLDLKVELIRSSIEESARLIDPRGFGMHGILGLEANLTGPASQVAVTGQLQVDDIHRWDLLPERGGGWKVPFKGSFDLRAENVEMESVPGGAHPPLTMRFRAWDILKGARWEAGADIDQIPVATVLEVMRHLGAPLPEKLAAEGSVSGSLSYTRDQGVGGRLELHDASLSLPDLKDAQPLKAATAVVAIEDGALRLEASTVQVGENESADLEGSFTLEAPRKIDLKITTRGLNVADMRSFGLAAIPMLGQTNKGRWRGWARYKEGEWSGESELQNAQVVVDGLADPVKIHSAAVTLNGERVSLSRLKASAGEIEFTGDYRWEPAAVRPHKFHIAIPKAELAELSRLLEPTLVRERGFIARTLGLGGAPPIEPWLKARRADGTVSVQALSVGDSMVRIDNARLLWDAGLIRLVGVNARLDQSAASGDVDVDLSGGSPHFHFDGRIQDVPYKGGKVDLEGVVDSDGLGTPLHAEGRLRGRGIAFSPEAEFRTVSACFELQGSRWKLSNVEAQQGGEGYLGSGASQPDGRMALDLARAGRASVHYTEVGRP
jgi:AsmA protein